MSRARNTSSDLAPRGASRFGHTAAETRVDYQSGIISQISDLIYIPIGRVGKRYPERLSSVRFVTHTNVLVDFRSFAKQGVRGTNAIERESRKRSG